MDSFFITENGKSEMNILNDDRFYVKNAAKFMFLNDEDNVLKFFSSRHSILESLYITSNSIREIHCGDKLKKITLECPNLKGIYMGSNLDIDFVLPKSIETIKANQKFAKKYNINLIHDKFVPQDDIKKVLKLQKLMFI